MMFRLSCWPVLLAAGLLVATPAFAQAPDDEGDEPDVEAEAVDEEEAVEEEEEEQTEPELEREREPEQPIEVETEPEAEPEPEPAVSPEPAIEEAPEPMERDAQDYADVEPDGADPEPATSGMAVAPAYAAPETNVRVIGNLEEGDRWALALGGYIRAGYTWIQADPDFERYGRNDGFTLHDARLTTRGEMDNGLGFVITLDAGSRLVRTTADSPVHELAVRLTDGYGYYSPFEFLEFNVGQFKAPFDVEDLISTSRMLFIHRSVANRGVQDVEGFNVPGLTQGRQVGAQARGKVPVFGGDDGLAVSYALAATNGNGANRSLNENSSLAMYGRTSVHWGDMVAVGGAVFRNDRTQGDPPDQIDRDHMGWTADVQFNAFGASLLANVVSESRHVPGIPQDPEATSLGYQVQLAYEEPFFGFQPAYRFAFYDRYYGEESEDDGADLLRDAALTYHTIGLNYNAQTYPVRVMANYTLTMEDDETRQLDNDRFDLLLQLQW